MFLCVIQHHPSVEMMDAPMVVSVTCPFLNSQTLGPLTCFALVLRASPYPGTVLAQATMKLALVHSAPSLSVLGWQAQRALSQRVEQ